MTAAVSSATALHRRVCAPCEERAGAMEGGGTDPPEWCRAAAPRSGAARAT